MRINKEQPSITVYSPDKKTYYGVVEPLISFSEDVNFNAASEVEITVADKYYDTDSEQWIDNPIYEQLIEDNLLYIADDNVYFRFPVRSIGDAEFYIPRLEDGSVDYSNLPKRAGRRQHWNPKNGYGHFTIQDETLLYDIGTSSGYAFPSAFLDDNGEFKPLDYDKSQYFRRGCKSFIPVNAGDIVTLNYFHPDYMDDSAEDEPMASQKVYSFKYRTYDKEDSSFLFSSDNTYYNRMNYIGMAGIGDQSTRMVVHNKPNDLKVHPQISGNNGYIRFTYNNADAWRPDNVRHWYTPSDGAIQIYSGERRCLSIDNEDKDGFIYPKLHWFVIKDISVQQDGFSNKKTIRAYSYEYTLDKRTCSFSEEYLPFYIPPCIKDFVESDDWAIDYSDEYLSNNETLGNEITIPGYEGLIRAPQRMSLGVMNQILEHLPNWKIGHISSELMTRFRKIKEVDNAHIYPMLMKDIQSAYQCYFVFDGDNQTISAYTQEDILQHSSVYFTWENTIKNIETTNSDTTYVNALRVYTAEDTYGLGLINPTGNNILYDFDYSVLGRKSLIDDNRFLEDAIDEWKQEYDASIEPYRILGKELINQTLNQIKLDSAVKLALANYHAKLDEINIYLADAQQESWGDKVMTPKEIESLYIAENNKEIGSTLAIKYSELKVLSNEYNSVKADLDEVEKAIDNCKSQMKVYITRLSLNYNTPDYNSHTPILSKEIRANLDYYIKEGDWTNENVVFSENYSSDDIYNTLIDVYNEAKADFSKRISKPKFEFTIDMINPLVTDEMSEQLDLLYLGCSCNVESKPAIWVSPTLLSIHLDYIDNSNTSLTFSTDYKRKPLYNRFADLFNTINQTSVKESVFIFEE